MFLDKFILYNINYDKKILTSNYFEILIYLISFLIILQALINKRISMEGFSTNKKKQQNKKIIYSIIPSTVKKIYILDLIFK